MKTLLSTLTLLFLFVGSSVAQEYGIASYYSNDFKGSQTAYGEKYDPNKMTCAHKSHPNGTLLKVTRLDNKQSVTVRVNDKGPFIKGRVVDLSYAAAQKIGLIKDGLAEVKIDVVGKGSKQPTAAVTPPAADIPTDYDIPTPSVNVAENVPTTAAPTRTVTERVSTSKANEAENAKPVATTKTASTAKKPAAEKPTMVARQIGEASMPTKLVTKKDYEPYGVYRIVLERPTTPGYGVQVASLANYDSVLKQVAELQSKWFDEILVNIEPGPGGVPAYKIIVGMFNSEASANNYKKDLARKHNIKGFVVPIAVQE